MQESAGIDFAIFINGAFFGNTGCMTTGGFSVTAPAMITSFSAVGTAGCAGVGNAPEWIVVGAG